MIIDDNTEKSTKSMTIKIIRKLLTCMINITVMSMVTMIVKTSEKILKPYLIKVITSIANVILITTRLS